MTKHKKLRVTVLYGGRSAERDVSINTGKQIIAHLDRKKYVVQPLAIPEKGDSWVRELLAHKPDVALLALHGPFGEDGAIQGLLEAIGIPYTCSGVLASALAMDKYRLCEMARAQGIKVPREILVSKMVGRGLVPRRLSSGLSRDGGGQAPTLHEIMRTVGFPCVVKPNQLGSSVGITVNVQNEKELRAALAFAFHFNKEVLVQEHIKGAEITIPILGNEKPRALPLIEIVPRLGRFYDYKSKYANGGSEHIIPARISKALTKKIKTLAIAVHMLIGARGVTRSDFIVRSGTPYFLEINTIPGMTATSLVPHSAQAAGISFSAFLDTLIALAQQP